MKKLLIIFTFTISTLSYSYGQCVVCDQPATGVDASIIGKYSTAAGAGSVAIGSNTHTLSTAGNSIAIGTMVKTVAGLSVVIGCGANSQNMLVNSNQRTLMIGFGSSKPTFFVGRSPAYNKTARIGIGIAGDISNPLLAKLHIRSDNDEPANLFLEPTNWTSDFNAEIWIGNQAHGISAEVNQGLVFKTENYYLFNQGNVGIGTPEPCSKLQVTDGDIFIEDINSGIIMKSPDGNCWRVSIDNNGNFVSTSITCPCNSGNVPEQKNNQEINIYPNPVQNIVNIEIISQKTKYFDIEIYNIQGKLIFMKQYKTSPLSIDISNLSNGIYMLKIKDENGNIIKNDKIIKN